MAKVIIKSINPFITGKKEYTLNAGTLSLSFREGVSAPVDEKFAEKFMTHFGESFAVEPIKGKPDELPKAEEKK